MLMSATSRPMSARITSETTPLATTPNWPKPRLSTCAIGPIKSTSSGRTNASTEAVPRMNMSAMIGAAMITERPMLRAGVRHSPARMATYSNPVRAPSASLVKMLRLWVRRSGWDGENDGSASANGRYETVLPKARLTTGNRIRARNVSDSSTPPALCTHLPTESPRLETATSTATSAQLKAVVNHLLSAIQRAPGPSAYDRLVTTVSPIPDITRMANTHRSQATMKPMNSLKPSLAHWYRPPSSGMRAF